MIPLPWLLAGALTLCAVCGWQGYRLGVSATEARQARAVAALEDRLADQSQAINAAAARIEADRQTREQMARTLEDEARSDGIDRTPAADGLRRLRSRWGAAVTP